MPENIETIEFVFLAMAQDKNSYVEILKLNKNSSTFWNPAQYMIPL